jgi:dihydrofolate synthase / folylpolyglutamate synthase
VRVSGEASNRILEAREFLGWKLGLERMRRLCSLLGMPQHRFASVHVVGTNGKTSVARMTAAILEAHGVRAGAYLSPHIHDWRERIVIGGEPIAEPALVEALERAEQAAAAADRVAPEDEGPVTQYELLTAAAFVAFAGARIQVAAVEAGLGGRLDATNVIPSKVTVLTSVGLDHTDWLGDTLPEIAAEKLAVLHDHSTLITGPLPEEVEQVAERFAGERHARRLRIGAGSTYPERNLAIAAAAAAEILGREPEPGAVEEVRRRISNPGRAQVIDGDPPVILDAAHNEPGARALAQALPSLAPGRQVVGCVAVLGDKDAEGIVRALAGACAKLVLTEVPESLMTGSGRPPSPSHPADELIVFAREAGIDAEAVPDPVAAWERARELARGVGGVALAAGSHYLLRAVWTERHAASS